MTTGDKGAKQGKTLAELTRAEYESIKSSGLLWELFPDAPENYEGIKMTHTPGPWEVRPSSNKDNGTDWRDIVSLGTPFTPSYVGEALVQDAALIAAAPEMYAFMKRCQTDPDFEGHTAEAELHRILAKAEVRA